MIWPGSLFIAYFSMAFFFCWLSSFAALILPWTMPVKRLRSALAAFTLSVREFLLALFSLSRPISSLILEETASFFSNQDSFCSPNSFSLDFRAITAFLTSLRRLATSLSSSVGGMNLTTHFCGQKSKNILAEQGSQTGCCLLLALLLFIG